jgi:hypothetical protein
MYNCLFKKKVAYEENVFSVYGFNDDSHVEL